MAQLTPTEKQDVSRYLDADKPLPDKFHFLLFEDKHEVELVWNGKTSEVCHLVLPFQVIEQVDEPRAEGPLAARGSVHRVQTVGERQNRRDPTHRLLGLLLAGQRQEGRGGTQGKGK